MLASSLASFRWQAGTGEKIHHQKQPSSNLIMFLPPLPVQGFLCAEEMHQSEFHPTHGNLREGTSSRRIFKVHSLMLMANEKGMRKVARKIANKQIT